MLIVTQIVKNLFNVEKNKNDAKLSTEYWKPANKKIHPDILECKRRIMLHNPKSRRCSLCLHEKLVISDDPDKILLNK